MIKYLPCADAWHWWVEAEESVSPQVIRRYNSCSCPRGEGYEQACAHAQALHILHVGQQYESIATATRETTIRETNNLVHWNQIQERGKPCFIRFGRPPSCGQSYDARDNHYESGVSVYNGFRVGTDYYVLIDDIDAFSFLFIRCRNAYEVLGQPIKDKGSDNEPLLSTVRIRRRITAPEAVWKPV